MQRYGPQWPIVVFGNGVQGRILRSTPGIIEEDGVEVTLSKWKNMVHAFPIMSPLFPEATAAINEICEFAVKHLENEPRN